MVVHLFCNMKIFYWSKSIVHFISQWILNMQKKKRNEVTCWNLKLLYKDEKCRIHYWWWCVSPCKCVITLYVFSVAIYSHFRYGEKRNSCHWDCYQFPQSFYDELISYQLNLISNQIVEIIILYCLFSIIIENKSI